MVKKFIVLTLILILAACNGGGGGSEKNVELLEITPEKADGICFASVTRPTLDSNYIGNIAGLIGGTNIISSDSRAIMVWGAGASLRWGTIGAQLGTAFISKPDTVTTVVSLNKNEAIFGTNKGIGVVGFNSSGNFAVLEYHELENGIVSGIAANDGYAYFIDDAGQIIRASRTQLFEGSCIDLIRSPSTWVDGENWYPTVLSAGKNILGVILQNLAPLPAISLGSEPARSILSEISTREIQHQIRILGAKTEGTTTSEGTTTPTSVDAENIIINIEADKKRSSFVPTGLAFDGNIMLVAGLAFDPDGAKILTETKCATSSDRIACLWDLAREGTLLSFKSGDYNVFTGRLLKLDPLTSEISRSKEIYLTPYAYTPAPPIVLVPATDGTNVYLRGTSFLLIMTQNDKDGWTEDHSYGYGTEHWGDITIGWPRQAIADVENGIITAVASPKNNTIPASSTLEHINMESIKIIVDTMSTDSKIVSVHDDNFMLLNKTGAKGGNLYYTDLKNNTMVKPSDEYATYVLDATYDGTNIAYAYVRNSIPKEIRLRVVDGIAKLADDDALSQPSFNRGTNIEPFKDFPEIDSLYDTSELETKQSIADIEWYQGNLYLLFHGYNNGKHYLRAGAIKLESDGYLTDKTFSGLIIVEGDENFDAAKILKMTNSTVYFSAPDGVYSALLDETRIPTKLLPFTNLKDIAVRGSSAVALDDNKIKKFTITASTSTDKTISGSTANGSIAYLESNIFVSQPDIPLISGYTTSLTSGITSTQKGNAVSLPSTHTKSILFLINDDGLIGLYNF